MMPCPACTGRRGLVRARSVRLLPGERIYRCADCRAAWRTHESDLGVMTPWLIIETNGQAVLPALPAPSHERLVGWERGAR